MSKLDVDLSSDQHLARRKKAITVLAWSGPGFFGTWILVNTLQALVLGRGIGRGEVAPFDPDDIHGHGLLVDAGLFLVTTLVLVAIVAGWYWVMSRLGPLPDQSEDDGEYEPLYLVYKPGLTKTLMWSAIACGVGIAGLGAAMLPVFLIKFGW